MAVYTHIDEQLLSSFLEQYSIGTPVSFKGIAEGVENSNYFLETQNKNNEFNRYILTIYEKRANPEDLPYFLNLMEHLAERSIPSPLPISDVNGEALQTLSGKPACIISFLSGVSVDFPNTEQCAALGANLAQMHEALSDFAEVRPNDLSLYGWHELAEKTLENADSVYTGLSELIEDELKFLTDHWPKNLPSGTIHADLFPDNILFTGNKITGIIDFYFSCHDMFAYDIAVCMNSWCFDADHKFLHTHAKRLVEMYDTTRSLSAQEMDALPILCRGAALRFLLTRLYDWLNPVEGAVVRPKDPKDYIERLLFHRSIRDTADYLV
ncbi:homoserine kinase [Kordiimonas sp. SCSIO 12610]|uniref:homoserine kinase n=1 Tax=Kordiimonas sp. SCSIO 12610 TaxID=2829597 RepID=UPI00210E67DD|nr:homoserine kinase [Kordiimonas sp. SCSIO 12610]UTW54897.1 homoserine kinase [Kordiimonas sp. SCSIO 12610]